MPKKNIIGLIPARMASSRLPGKPMAKLQGIPMIGHCYFRSKQSPFLDEVYVATCDIEIADYIESIGGKAVMTASTHERASDRCAEALEKIEIAQGSKADIVVMLQGDEPMLLPEMIEMAVQPLLNDPSILVSNLMSDLLSQEEHEDPAEVKVVVDRENFALYFSREPIPSRKKGARNIPMQKQVCVIPFQRDFLIKYSQMEPTPLEIIESIDMNRVLEHGMKIKMVKIPYKTYSVDTQEDLQRVDRLMANDALIATYRK